jgi:hypothetical protein
MESILPDFMLPVLPFKDNSSIPSESMRKEVLDFLKKRPSLSELQAKIASENWDASNNVFEVMLMMGSKTFSHLLNAFERYSSLFHESSRDSQMKCLAVAFDFWAQNPQNLHIVFEKMIHYGIVDPGHVIEFLFDKAARSFASLSAKDIHEFEVEILIKILASDFFLKLIRKVKSDKPAFAKNLIERIIHFGSAVKVDDSAASRWLPWTVQNIVKDILRGYFACESGNVKVRQVLLEIAENNSNFPPQISEMFVGIVESMN